MHWSARRGRAPPWAFAILVLCVAVIQTVAGQDEPFAASLAANALSGATHIEVADMDGDGTLDFVVSAWKAEGTNVKIQRGVGSVFQQHTPDEFQYVVWPIQSAAADFNNDGRMDLAVVDLLGGVNLVNGDDAAGSAGRTWVFINRACLAGDENDPFCYNAGQLVDNEIPGSQLLRAADLDGDGNADLVVGATKVNFGDKLVWFKGDGAGSFFPEARIVAQSSTARGLAHIEVTDINADGRPDLVSSTASGAVLWYLNTGGTTNLFASAREISAGLSTSDVLGMCVTKLNGDTYLDVVLASAGKVSMWAGGSSSTFGAETVLIDFGAGAPDPTALACGDVNGDGKGDLVVGFEEAFDSDDETTSTLAFYGGGGGGSNEGDCELVAPLWLPAVAAQDGLVSAIAVVDIDDNGRVDVLAARPFSSQERGEVRFYRNVALPATLTCPGSGLDDDDGFSGLNDLLSTSGGIAAVVVVIALMVVAIAACIWFALCRGKAWNGGSSDDSGDGFGGHYRRSRSYSSASSAPESSWEYERNRKRTGSGGRKRSKDRKQHGGKNHKQPKKKKKNKKGKDDRKQGHKKNRRKEPEKEVDKAEAHRKRQLAKQKKKQKELKEKGGSGKKRKGDRRNGRDGKGDPGRPARTKRSSRAAAAAAVDDNDNLPSSFEVVGRRDRRSSGKQSRGGSGPGSDAEGAGRRGARKKRARRPRSSTPRKAAAGSPVGSSTTPSLPASSYDEPTYGLGYTSGSASYDGGGSYGGGTSSASASS